jgi:anaerobic selenocysteine-containing dehydrogenase
MKVQVEDGRIRRIEPHSGNQATPGSACLKGLAYVERVHSPDRILHPLRRVPGSGEFERISWDDALDIIAEKLVELKADPGPQSILYYSGSGTKGLLKGAGREFWWLYGGCTATYGDLCWPAGLEDRDVRRPLLAGGAGGDASDPRREQAQRALGYCGC